MSHLMRADGKIPPAHPSILCYSVMLVAIIAATGYSMFKNVAFFWVGSFCVWRVGIDIYESEHPKGQRSTVTWLSSQGERGYICLYPKPVIFHYCRFSPQAGFLRLAWPKLCQGLKYIWGVAGRRAFQDHPLWPRIRAFSSALNNSCRESICLVRFFFSST